MEKEVLNKDKNVNESVISIDVVSDTDGNLRPATIDVAPMLDYLLNELLA